MNITVNSINSDLLMKITNELQRIIIYIQEHLINIKKIGKNINLESKQEQNGEELYPKINKFRRKLGIKRKYLSDKNENKYENEKNEISLDENKDNINKNEKEINEAKYKKLKSNIKKLKNNSSIVVKMIQNLLNKINEYKIKNFYNIKINSNQELNLNSGRYIGNVVNGLREGKGIMYYKNGDRYEGDWKNNKREGKGIYLIYIKNI